MASAGRGTATTASGSPSGCRPARGPRPRLRGPGGGAAGLGPRKMEARDANLVGGALTAAPPSSTSSWCSGRSRGSDARRRRSADSTSARVAHPGGGVHGACGDNAARAALLHDRCTGWCRVGRRPPVLSRLSAPGQDPGPCEPVRGSPTVVPLAALLHLYDLLVVELPGDVARDRHDLAPLLAAVTRAASLDRSCSSRGAAGARGWWRPAGRAGPPPRVPPTRARRAPRGRPWRRARRGAPRRRGCAPAAGRA